MGVAPAMDMTSVSTVTTGGPALVLPSSPGGLWVTNPLPQLFYRTPGTPVSDFWCVTVSR